MTIGIAGGTGSGKTTLTRRLQQQFGEDVSVLYHDNYYKAHDEMTYEERSKLNYDHPDAFENAAADRAFVRAKAWRTGGLPGL
jgi:uridine kinase